MSFHIVYNLDIYQKHINSCDIIYFHSNPLDLIVKPNIQVDENYFVQESIANVINH